MTYLVVIAYVGLALLVYAGSIWIGLNLYVRPLEARERERVKNLVEAQIAEAERIREEAQKEVEAIKRQALLEAREESLQIRAAVENENREKRAEIQQIERRLAQKEEALERRSESLEIRERQLQEREQEVARLRTELAEAAEKQRKELERISGLTAEEARALFLKTVEDESRHHAARLIRDIEETARREGEKRARQIITDCVQRCAVDQTSETTVSVVPLPSDEMKGRIIGREGRNIRAFETLTGVDLIIDDTPEAVVLSGFDPVRREVARIALTNLIVDGRIHPGRIEEVVRKAQAEVESRIQEAGERAVLETGLTGLAPEIVHLLGKMKYRTSYGQNVLKHSVEVSHICGMLAAELGADVWVARRAGLLHDLGKAVDFEQEGPHALISGEILRRYREPESVAHAAEAHHYDVEPTTLEAILVICADQISASRPGARRETLETYVKRLRKLEEIGDAFEGVEKTFAVQAGREIRVIVRPDKIDDLASIQLAHDMARRIEEEMEYPGQIKVTVIRETRAVDYAR
ncbi:MAG: ribonuclease Y [Chloroherpetonaceae bacterium]|nr:ribonuclease Y [Chthonomonadaceae bacterium]MDW8207631.1 ribonuclease Y [Chloroherpetonaceae bacterium]